MKKFLYIGIVGILSLSLAIVCTTLSRKVQYLCEDTHITICDGDDDNDIDDPWSDYSIPVGLQS